MTKFYFYTRIASLLVLALGILTSGCVPFFREAHLVRVEELNHDISLLQRQVKELPTIESDLDRLDEKIEFLKFRKKRLYQRLSKSGFDAHLNEFDKITNVPF